MTFNTDELIQLYFDQKNILINHQINSYNYYVDVIIPKIIKQYFPVFVNFTDSSSSIEEIELSVQKLRIGEPLLIENNGCSKLMTPNIARERNSTYLSPIIVDFSIFLKFDSIYFILGNSSKVWNGGGEVTVHSKVVAPSPHGFCAAAFFLENA